MGQSLNRAFITDFTRNMGSVRDLLCLLLINYYLFVFATTSVFCIINNNIYLITKT